jgi:4-carboxymuconolactone decarboxylase
MPAKQPKSRPPKPKRTTSKRVKSRLEFPTEDSFTEPQRALRDAIASGPRGTFKMSGPFAIWLHAPEIGLLAQALGGHCRYKTTLSPRLSEFAILVTARAWRAQYEWQAHAPMAEKAGVSAKSISAIRAGRAPTGAPADERAIYDFVTELYRARRVGNRTYARVVKALGTKGTVELVGILGYYALISMTLNVFQAETDPAKPLPFTES